MSACSMEFQPALSLVRTHGSANQVMPTARENCRRACWSHRGEAEGMELKSKLEEFKRAWCIHRETMCLWASPRFRQ